MLTLRHDAREVDYYAFQDLRFGLRGLLPNLAAPRCKVTTATPLSVYSILLLVPSFVLVPAGLDVAVHIVGTKTNLVLGQWQRNIQMPVSTLFENLYYTAIAYGCWA